MPVTVGFLETLKTDMSPRMMTFQCFATGTPANPKSNPTQASRAGAHVQLSKGPHVFPQVHRAQDQFVQARGLLQSPLRGWSSEGTMHSACDVHRLELRSTHSNMGS